MEGKKINRRAMKDIGNIVGALSAKCTITKGRVAPTKKLGATLAKTQAMMQVAPPHKEVEEHMNLGTRKRNAMLPSVREGNQKKHELENSYVAMKNCPTLVSVPCHQEIISQSEETFLKNESESKIIDLTYQDEDDDECCEMEIEEAEDPVPDIDEADKGNPLAVADYVQDIYSFYRETEVRSCVPPDYMSHQPDINEKMRAILVDWLIKIHLEFKLMDETLFLVINIFDRYLSRKTVVRKSLQLVAVAAMFVACKYEELSIPIVEDFIYISDNAYTRDEILQMEKSILNTLQFSLALPTPFVFMKRFLKAAGSDRNLEMVSSFLVELCLVEYVMLKYPPSMVAAAAVYTGHCTLKRAPFWNRTMVFHTTYTEDHLIECSKLMVGFHKNAREGKLTGVHRKYSTPKFHGVAKLEPALFIGENPQSPSPVSFIRI